MRQRCVRVAASMDDERLPIAIVLPQRNVRVHLIALVEYGELRVVDHAHDRNLRSGRTAAPSPLTDRILARPQSRAQLPTDHHDLRSADRIAEREFAPGAKAQAE